MAVAPLDVLCCRITIGDPDAGNPMSILNPITLTEVQEVEIVETYKKLIGTATIRFPKGTIFRSTIIGTATLEGKDAQPDNHRGHAGRRGHRETFQLLGDGRHDLQNRATGAYPFGL